MTTPAAAAGTAASPRALAAIRSARVRISITSLATGPSKGPAMWNAPAEGSDGASRLKRAIGGKRGIVDGTVSPLVFVIVNAIATTHAPRPTALPLAISAAVGAGAALVVLRLVRKEPLKQALQGLAGLAIAVVFALRAGEARAFFLPGIYVDGAYALVFAGSALVGRPLIATVYRWLYGRARQGEVPDCGEPS
jgi:hypothetical protein